MFLSYLNAEERQHFMSLLVYTAKVDGDFTDAEKNAIIAYENEMDLEHLSHEAYTNANPSVSDLLSFFETSSLRVKKVVVTEISALMLTDGMKPEEEDLLQKMLQTFGLSKEFLRDVMLWYKDILPLYQKGFDLVLDEGGAK